MERGYLGEEKRFFGGSNEVGDVVGCFWERGDEGGDGGCSHRDFFPVVVGRGVESYVLSTLAIIRLQLVPGYKTKDSSTFKALTTPKRFNSLTGGSSQRPTMMGVDTVRYNNVLSLNLSHCSHVSPIQLHTPYFIKVSYFFRV